MGLGHLLTAIGMLKHRATAYSVMYDGLRQRRSGVDHFFSPSQQTSTRATLAYAHARFSTVPLILDDMNIVQIDKPYKQEDIIPLATNRELWKKLSNSI